jgi:hypothetical protein
LFELALALQSTGDIATSIHALTVSLELNPHQSAVYHNLSRLVLTGDYQFSEQQVGHIQTLLSTYADIPSFHRQTCQMAFALGSYFEQRNDAAQAYHYYAMGNHRLAEKLKGTTIADESHAFRNGEQRLQTIFAQGSPTVAPQAVGDNRCLPVFVLGVPRSGSTLVAQILASHPEVGSIGESTALDDALYPYRQHWESAEGERTPDNANTLIKTTNDSAAVYLATITARHPQAARVVDKMLDNSRYVGFVASWFPAATLLWCCRDPRDVAVSHFSLLFQNPRLQWESSTWERIAEAIRSDYEALRFWESRFPGRIHRVYYERLVQRPEAETRRIIGATGLTWSDACLEPHLADSGLNTASSIQVRQPIYATSVGRWQRFAEFMGPVFDLLGNEIDQYVNDLAAAD